MSEEKLSLQDLLSGKSVQNEIEPNKGEVKIEVVGIIGGGIAGGGIAQAVASANIDVILVEKNQSTMDRSLKKLAESMDREIQRWGMTASEKKAILQKIKGTFSLNDLKDADIVIEAVDEDLALKKYLFKRLDEICSPNTVIASNTSTLSLSSLASETSRGQRIIGVHFLNPVPKIPLVEIVKGMDTSEETLKIAKIFAKKLGKTAVEVFEYPGFITTRIIIPFINEAMHVFMEGLASAEDIDTAMKLGYNLPMGPLELADTMGLDEVWAWMNSLWKELGEPRFRPCPYLRILVRERKLGKKTGMGFFKYDNNGRKIV